MIAAVGWLAAVLMCSLPQEQEVDRRVPLLLFQDLVNIRAHLVSCTTTQCRACVLIKQDALPPDIVLEAEAGMFGKGRGKSLCQIKVSFPGIYLHVPQPPHLQTTGPQENNLSGHPAFPELCTEHLARASSCCPLHKSRALDMRITVFFTGKKQINVLGRMR